MYDIEASALGLDAALAVEISVGTSSTVPDRKECGCGGH
jgi:hypothetical protein